MNRLSTRLFAAVAALAVTFAVVNGMANYAHPAAESAMQLAAAQPAGSTSPR